MKTSRALLTASVIWILGVSAYVCSFFLPFTEDVEFQANLVLAFSLIPLAWFGSKFYYTKNKAHNGFVLAAIMVGTAVVLDAIWTVPLLVLPEGGTYLDFFGALSFWSIALVYYLTVVLYWWLNIRPLTIRSYN